MFCLCRLFWRLRYNYEFDTQLWLRELSLMQQVSYYWANARQVSNGCRATHWTCNTGYEISNSISEYMHELHICGIYFYPLLLWHVWRLLIGYISARHFWIINLIKTVLQYWYDCRKMYQMNLHHLWLILYLATELGQMVLRLVVMTSYQIKLFCKDFGYYLLFNIEWNLGYDNHSILSQHKGKDSKKTLS